MIYKTEPLDRVIDAIIRNLGLGQNDIPYTDFVEWCADALEHIGAYNQLIDKEAIIDINDYQGLLPCDLYKVIRLKNACQSIENPSGGFYDSTLIGDLNKAGTDLDVLTPRSQFFIGTQGIAKWHNNTYEELKSKLTYNGNLIGNVPSNRHSQSDYKVTLNKITTGFQSGFIEIQYQAVPVDDRGWPMVPDNVSFRDALFWKVAMHLSMREPETMKNPRMQDMEYCRQMWNRYCKQARAEATMPDLDQMERIKNIFYTLIPNVSRERQEYRGLGQPQFLNLDGNGRK